MKAIVGACVYLTGLVVILLLGAVIVAVEVLVDVARKLLGVEAE